MNFLIKNKHGSEKLLSVYWFAILFIVAAGIVYMALLFYGIPYDVREAEANLLLNKVSDCLVQNQYLNNEIFLEGFEETFLEKCGLTFEVENFGEWKDDQYYVEFFIFSFDDTQEKNKGGILTGAKAGEFHLRDLHSTKLDKSPFGIERSFYALDESNVMYVVEILSIVNKEGKNVR